MCRPLRGLCCLSFLLSPSIITFPRTQMISVEEALKIIVDNATPLSTQTVATEKALSFVSVNDILADRPLPPFNRVAMDGYAVRSADFDSSEVELKLKGQVQTGIESELEIEAGEAVNIMTGAPCPQGADAVVKVENSELKGDTVILREEKMYPGLNVAIKGEDKSQGDLLVRSGKPLSAADIAVAASVGLAEIEVYKKPRVKIISTGTEIVHPSVKPLPHQIRDCNSYSLRTMCNRYQLDNEFLGIGEDDEEVLSGLIQKGLDSEILLLSGGVSMGDYDHVPNLLAGNGVKKIFHKIKVKPGKPVWFGKTDNGTYVFGLPGNPVSVQTCFRIFVEPLIKKLSGYMQPHHMFLKLPLSEDAKSKTPRDHYTPGKIKATASATEIEPVYIRGSGDFSNFADSQGLFLMPGAKRILKKGELVDFLPWSDTW